MAKWTPKTNAERVAYAVRLANKLQASEIRANLLRTALFLTAFEMVKYLLVEKLKGFVAEPRYETEVLALHKKKFAASCLWYLKYDVLTQEHVDDLHAIREHRDKVAHDVVNFLLDPDAQIDEVLLAKARACMQVLSRFWLSIDLESDPQFDGQELDLDTVSHGPMDMFDYLRSVMSETIKEQVGPQNADRVN